MPFGDAANGATTTLSVKKRLVLLRSASPPVGLDFLVQLGETVATTILALAEGWKLILRLFSPTSSANGLPISNIFMFGLMEPTPDQV